jgi:hypothetical protein
VVELENGQQTNATAVNNENARTTTLHKYNDVEANMEIFMIQYSW